jgi:hypothetical protein
MALEVLAQLHECQMQNTKEGYSCTMINVSNWMQTFHLLPLVMNKSKQPQLSTQSYLLADKKIFEDIKQRILTIDKDILASLSDRIEKEEFVKAESEEEKRCFQLLKDLDHVSGPVKGSNTSKKWMHNEVWSLIYISQRCTLLVYNTITCRYKTPTLHLLCRPYREI